MRQKADSTISSRDALFDNFRGILVYIFVMISILGGIYRENASLNIPTWLFNHGFASPIGPWGIPFTLVDLGMIFFYFIGGMTAVRSYKSRARAAGKKAARKSLFARGIGLMGIATVFNLIGAIFSKDYSVTLWGPLSAIGLTGIFVLPFLGLKAPWRALVGVAILAAYQLFLTPIYAWLTIPTPPGQIIGADGGAAVCVAYAGFFLLTTVLFDLYEKKFVYFLLGLLPIIIYTAVTYSIFPPKAGPYNTTFFAVTYCAVALIFTAYCILQKSVMYLAQKITKRKLSGRLPLLNMMGRNLLLYYLIRYPIAMIGILLYNSLLIKTGVYLGGIIIAAGFSALFYVLERFLQKKHIVVKL